MIETKFTNERGQVGIGTLIVFIALVLVAAIAAGVLINTAGFLQTQAEETGSESTDQVADNINVIGQVGSVLEDDGGTNAVYEARLTVQRSPGSSEIDLTGLSIQWVGDNGFAQLVYAGDASEPGAIQDSSDQTVVGPPNDALASNNRGDAAYLVDVVTAESDSDAVITEDGDRYEIVVPLGIMKDPSTNDNIVLADDGLTTGADTATPTLSTIDSDLSTADVGGNAGFDNGDLDTLKAGQSADLEITTDSGSTRNVVVTVPDTLIDQEGDTVTL